MEIKTEESMVIVDRWSWESAASNMRKEKQLVRMFLGWAAMEQPPCRVTISADMGYRVFIHPDKGIEEEKFHALLSWLVRQSGKRFERHVRTDTTSILWWNTSIAKGTTDNEDFGLDGQTIKGLFLLEDAPLGKCRIVETEELVKVKKVVCDGD